MKTIGIIGQFGKNKNLTNGKTIHTKQIYKYLDDSGYKINKYDTYNIRFNFVKVLCYAIRSLKKCDAVIIILSSRGYSIFLPCIVFFNKLYKKKIFDFVIGGNRDKIIGKNKYLLKLQNKVDKIYVETDKMVNDYSKLGLYNVSKISNFKYLEKQKIPKFKKKNFLNVCTFSRVCEKKGILDSIESVIRANQKLKESKIQLTIYGEVDDNFINKFNELKKTFPKYIKYGGIVNYSDTSKVLKDYDILLFQTFWDSEGMPGTLIDAFYAGLPVIASDWNHNKEFIIDNYNGRIVKVHDINNVSDLLIYYYNNQFELYKMKKNCSFKALDYSPEKVMEVFIENLEKFKV